MWVVKIGGSLHDDPRLATWLARLCADRERRWLLVPGGGPYADAVRAQQRVLGYDDGEAHRRAIAAMARYGEDLLAIAPNCERWASLAVVRARAHAAHPAPALWLPGASDFVALRELPADWRVTSDSIAHAVATRIGAEALVLVKSVAPPAGLDASALAQCGWIDEWFPRRLASSSLPVYWTTIGAADGALRDVSGLAPIARFTRD